MGEDRQGLSISSVAQRVRLRPSALRYYESVGVIPPPARIRGQRRYDPSIIGLLDLVRLAQDAGFTMAEIRHLVAGFEGGTPPRKRWQLLATRKRHDVQRRIEAAQGMLRVLDALLSCECSELPECVKRCDPRTIPGLTRKDGHVQIRTFERVRYSKVPHEPANSSIG